MCSWCWGFEPSLDAVEAALPAGTALRWVMGGLASDSDEPMPDELRAYVQSAWRAVAERTGATFNHDFWKRCEPRRSTYPACRAVIAAEAKRAGKGRAMFRAIQRAYYLEARNPSDASTLEELAAELGLDREAFASDLRSPQVDALLTADLTLARSLDVSGFPTLVLDAGGRTRTLVRGWAAPEEAVERVLAALGRG